MTIPERILTDGSDSTCHSIICDTLGNHHITFVLFDVRWVPVSLIRDGGFVAVDVVVDTIHLKVVG